MKVMYAENGKDGISVLQKTPDIDAVLMDVMMPGMDGFEVCRRLRADPLLGEVPVIMLTALDDRDARLQAIEAGADDFISKPFDRVELRGRVRTIARLNRYRRLLAERAKFGRVVELAPDGMLVVDAAGMLALANPALVRMLDAQQAADLLGRHITTFVVPEQRDDCFALLRHISANPAGVVRCESLFVRAGGACLPVELHAGYAPWDNQPAAQIIVRDISERKRAELLEEERRHIAYELHDGLAQLVTSAHQHLQAFAARYRPRSPQARQDLGRALDLAQRSAQEVRRVISGLRPTALDDLGLGGALQMQVAALRADGWAITFQSTLGDERQQPALETVIFRVAMEALANIRKHAQTTRALLLLERQAACFRLLVQDWGCGFDPAATSAAGLGERIGLRGMRERMALVGGRCDIDSALGGGTRVVATAPLPFTQAGGSSDES
jgi:PAS domain S-box-containing protein